MFFDRGNHHVFTSVVKELAAPGEMTKNATFPFTFPNAEKSYETYKGVNARLRYHLECWSV